MYWHTTNYRKDEPTMKGRLLHRGFWLHGILRPLIWCRLRGHKPVVDGYGPHRPGLDAARWVACDRCGVRPEPQGNLNPDEYAVGQQYTDDFDGVPVDWDRLSGQEFLDMKSLLTEHHTPPGPWPGRSDWEFGGELILGKTFGVFGAEVKVGNAGSEQVLAAHLRIWPFGALYLHTERLGTWLQRRLVPTGYESRVIGLTVGDWRIRWQLWAKRNESSRSDPWWMRGSINLDLVEWLLGPKRYSYEDVGDPVDATVRMPHGDDHDVVLQLQRQTYGRKHGRKAQSWMVDWISAPGSGGIPTKLTDRGHILGFGVAITSTAALSGHWQSAATVAIAQRLTEDRARYGWHATPQEATT